MMRPMPNPFRTNEPAPPPKADSRQMQSEFMRKEPTERSVAWAKREPATFYDLKTVGDVVARKIKEVVKPLEKRIAELETALAKAQAQAADDLTNVVGEFLGDNKGNE